MQELLHSGLRRWGPRYQVAPCRGRRPVSVAAKRWASTRLCLAAKTLGGRALVCLVDSVPATS